MENVIDEEQPLLRVVSLSDDPENGVKHDDVRLEFEPEDAEDPRNWSDGFKWFIVLLLAFMAFTVTFTCVGVVPVAGRIVEDLDGQHATSSSSTLLVTIWEFGEAAGPLLIAPLSELYGRHPVMNACNIGFIAATLLAARSQSSAVFIAARMLTGLSVASNVLNPAIIGDMFASEQRGSAMSLIMLAPLIGGAIGPAISGAIAQTVGWRAIVVIATGLAVLCEVLFLICFKETYRLAILKRRLAALQDESDEAGKSAGSRERHEKIRMLWFAVTRPFAVLFGSRVLMLVSLYASMAFSVFYVISVSLPGILMEEYGFNSAQTGTAFMSFSVGSFVTVMVCHFCLDRIYIRLRGLATKGKPEYRLPLSITGSLFLPIAIAAYGWIAQYQLPVFFLLASVAFLGCTLLLTVIPVSAYVVDACGLYSASAMTGVIVTRCLMGTFLPLATGPLAEKLGYGWGFSCLAALMMCLASIPILLLIYGEDWRQRSEFTRDT